MRKDLIHIVCCPADKARLELEGEQLDDHGDVVSGTLRCTECGFAYPVEDGIPNLLPPAYHVGNVGAKSKAAKGAGGTAAKGAGAKSDSAPPPAKASEAAQVSGAAKPEAAVADERAAVDE